MVLTAGDTIGFAKTELNPAGELVHEYLFPLTALPPIKMYEVLQIDVLLITAAAGKGMTVIITESVLLHPVELAVSVI